MLKADDKVKFVVNDITLDYEVRCVTGSYWLRTDIFYNGAVFSVLGVNPAKACADAGIILTGDAHPSYWPVVGSAKDLQRQINLVNKLISEFKPTLSTRLVESSFRFGCQSSYVLDIIRVLRADATQEKA